jgi:hypothetical protein
MKLGVFKNLSPVYIVLPVRGRLHVYCSENGRMFKVTFVTMIVSTVGGCLVCGLITIRYKGLTVVRGLEQTVLTFPNGESVIVKEEAPCIVEM